MRMKTTFQRILAYNLTITLLLAVGLRLLNRGRDSSLGFLLLMALGLAVQVAALLGLALGSRVPERKRAYWLSLALVMLIGFGACAVGASINM